MLKCVTEGVTMTIINIFWRQINKQILILTFITMLKIQITIFQIPKSKINVLWYIYCSTYWHVYIVFVDSHKQFTSFVELFKLLLDITCRLLYSYLLLQKVTVFQQIWSDYLTWTQPQIWPSPTISGRLRHPYLYFL